MTSTSPTGATPTDEVFASQTTSAAPPAWLDARVSVFASAKAVVPCEALTVAVLLDRVRCGYWKDVELLRQRREKSEAEYQKAKHVLPAITLSGMVRTRAKSATAAAKGHVHSGLLQGDLDHKDNPRLLTHLDRVKGIIARDPHTAFVFVSPSGVGLKTGILIDPGRHVESFTVAAAHYKDTYDLVLDPRTKDVLRLFFVSDDPDVRLNPTAKPIVPPRSRNEPVLPDVIKTHSASVFITSGKTVEVETSRRGGKASALKLELESTRERLYRGLVADMFPHRAGGRNDALCGMVPFLHLNMAKEVAQSFVVRYLSEGSYHETIGRHLRSFLGLWEGCVRAYPDSLACPERTIYGSLPTERHRITFRIARKLGEGGDFFLTCGGLAVRLGDTTSKDPANRLLKEFWEARRIIDLIEKGYRKPGGKSRGTIWRYRLHDARASIILPPPSSV